MLKRRLEIESEAIDKRASRGPLLNQRTQVKTTRIRIDGRKGGMSEKEPHIQNDEKRGLLSDIEERAKTQNSITDTFYFKTTSVLRRFFARFSDCFSEKGDQETC